MDNRPPIERVREREDNARRNFDDARETLSQKDAKLRHEASEGAPVQETEEQFEERMREKLKESGNTDDNDNNDG